MSVFLYLALMLNVGTVATTQVVSGGVVDELSKWARESVAGGRQEQLALRFEPLIATWRASERGVDAEALLRVWAELEPTSLRVWTLLAEVQVAARDFVSAHASYTRAVVLHDDSALHLGVALAAWELGDVEGSDAAFEAALARAPSTTTRFQWARFLLWRGRGEQAYAAFNALPRALHQQPDVAFLLAQACAGAIDPDQGKVRSKERGSERNGSEENGPKVGGREESCDPDTAVLLFQKAVVLLPEHAEVRYGLARAYQRAGNRSGAQEQMELYRELVKRDQEKGQASRNG